MAHDELPRDRRPAAPKGYVDRAGKHSAANRLMRGRLKEQCEIERDESPFLTTLKEISSHQIGATARPLSVERKRHHVALLSGERSDDGSLPSNTRAR